MKVRTSSFATKNNWRIYGHATVHLYLRSSKILQDELWISLFLTTPLHSKVLETKPNNVNLHHINRIKVRGIAACLMKISSFSFYSFPSTFSNKDGSHIQKTLTSCSEKNIFHRRKNPVPPETLFSWTLFQHFRHEERGVERVSQNHWTNFSMSPLRYVYMKV